MTLSRISRSVHLDIADIDGVCNVLAKRMANLPNSPEYDIRFAQYEGAYQTLYILTTTEILRTQADFMTVFESNIEKDGE